MEIKSKPEISFPSKKYDVTVLFHNHRNVCGNEKIVKKDYSVDVLFHTYRRVILPRSRIRYKEMSYEGCIIQFVWKMVL